LDGSLVLWLDDSGAGPDTDYDDMVVRISEISEVLPPALLLFGSGLLGMNWLRGEGRTCSVKFSAGKCVQRVLSRWHRRKKVH